MSGKADEGGWPQIWEVFEEALDQPPEVRAAFLDRACGGNVALRQAVEQMLAADQGADTLLDQPIFSSGRAAAQREPVAVTRQLKRGSILGAYRILRRVGQGGMSTVYLAVRNDDTFQRHVVVKLVRPGMESETILERLRTERQILASLDHPNIARLYDGGTTEDGLPYFVMEYVEGVPIDAFCEQSRLSVDERLDLFRKVCGSVHYAHQNLVVHRDIKPSNILVTAEGEPKLLDFGIAKLLNPGLAASPAEPTATWQRALTPNYASPEQIRGKLITTVSDVYSLGVLLYKMLTGRLPRQFRGRTVDEIASSFTESEPLPPSAAVTRRAGGSEASDQRRRPTDETETLVGRPDDGAADSPDSAEATTRVREGQVKPPPDEIRRQLSGDLDAILLKALRSAPQRRYTSVERFANDIERYREGRPVTARAGSWRYRSGKFLRRNRRPVAAVAAVVLLLTGFVVAMMLQASRVADQYEQTLAERDKKAVVLKLVVELFELSNPYVQPGEELTVREALERSIPVLGDGLHEQPAVRSELLHTSGSILTALGAYRPARDQLAEALAIRNDLYGEKHPDVAESQVALAWALKELGKLEEAEALARDAVAITGDLLPRGHPLHARSLNELVSVMCYRFEFEEAEEPANEALDIARTLPGNKMLQVDSLMQMARVRNFAGDYREGARLNREAIALIREHFGENHPDLIVPLDNLGFCLRRLNELDAAETAYLEALKLQADIFGEEHQNAYVLNNLAGVRFAKGEYDSAAELYQQAHDVVLKRAGPDHWRLYFYGVRIERTRIRQGDPAGAERNLRQMLIRWAPVLEDNWRRDEGLSILGEAVSRQGRCDEAETILVESFENLVAKARERARRDGFDRLREHLERCGKSDEIDRFAALLDPPA
ncbi:MAG: serine/threonine-protein kinase [Acidobacteriota bacterium]